jgi:hypothetical protein
MVEQATAASHSLSDEAMELARLVGQFRIGESVSAPVLKQAASKPRAVLTTSARKMAMPRQGEAARPALGRVDIHLVQMNALTRHRMDRNALGVWS